MKHFVVYQNPSDFPGQYVLRVWHIMPGVSPLPLPEVVPRAVSKNLNEIYQHIPEGFTNIGRMPDDESAILEVWI